MGRDGVRPGNSGIADRDRAEEGIGRQFCGFAAFLAANAVSASCPDHIKSDVMYVAMELLDCCTMAGVDLGIPSQVGGVIQRAWLPVVGGRVLISSPFHCRRVTYS